MEPLHHSNRAAPVLGGPILGLGIDLIETHRIEALVDQFGIRFLQRIFLPGELAYTGSLARPGPHLAARFAAKEAAAKALGTGIGRQAGWLEIEVIRTGEGRPLLQFWGTAAATAEQQGVRSSWISLTHTKSHGLAQVILTG